MEQARSTIKLKLQQKQGGMYYMTLMCRVTDMENKYMFFEIAKSSFAREGRHDLTLTLLHLQHALYRKDDSTILECAQWIMNKKA